MRQVPRWPQHGRAARSGELAVTARGPGCAGGYGSRVGRMVMGAAGEWRVTWRRATLATLDARIEPFNLYTVPADV